MTINERGSMIMFSRDGDLVVVISPSDEDGSKVILSIGGGSAMILFGGNKLVVVTSDKGDW